MKHIFDVGVFAIILDEDKKILLCHRRDYDLWNLPGGGLEQAETVEDGIVREVKEETGLDIIVERVTGIYTKKEEKAVALSFLCTVIGGEITLNDEADKIEYFDLDTIPKNFIPKQLERIKDYLNEPEKIHYKVQMGKSAIQLFKEGELG